MIVVSDALPIQFWPIGVPTFNESQFGFIDSKPYYQEFSANEVIRLQVYDTVNTTYGLEIKDCNENIIEFIQFAQTPLTTGYSYDLNFQISVLLSAYSDSYLRFYITTNNGTFDSTFDDTFDTGYGTELYKSDLVKFSINIRTTPSWGSKLFSYKSNYNFANIKYPVADYFNLRLPCRFFRERNTGQQSSISLTNAKTINTSTYRKRQKYLETWALPDYMLNKLELVLDHAVRGSVMADGVEWIVDESFDRSSPDSRFSMQFAKIWLTRKDYSIRNIV